MIFFKPNVEKLEKKKDVEGLIKALKCKKTPKIRDRAAEALGKVGGEKGVEPLIQALKDEELFVRKTAVKALGEVGDERAIEPLIQALKDTHRGAQEEISWALEKIGEPAVGSLIQALKDEGENVRLETSKILGKIGDARAVRTSHRGAER